MVRQMKQSAGLSEPELPKKTVATAVAVEKPVITAPIAEPVPEINLTTEAPADTYSVMQEEPEIFRPEFTLNEAASEIPGIITRNDALAKAAETTVAVVGPETAETPAAEIAVAVAEPEIVETPAAETTVAVVEPEIVESTTAETVVAVAEPEIVETAVAETAVPVVEPAIAETAVAVVEPEIAEVPAAVEVPEFTPAKQIEELVPEVPLAQLIRPEPSNMPAPEDLFTINDKISAQLGDKTVSKTEQLAIKPISDIKLAITLNDKLLYVKDLFNGYNLAYSEAIEILNRFNTFEEASRFLKTNYVTKNNWESKPATTEKFYALLKRRYA
jgi:hypothetical protein